MAKGDGGWVQVEKELCIACGACVDVCPFSAVVVGPDDVATKCDGCVDEIGRGWKPTCVRACPMRALDYGSAVSPPPETRAQDQDFQGHGIGPSVLYLRRAED
jgi:Fe-S-cluster-containing dehydrogenase component